MSKSTKARLSLSDEAFSLFAAPSAASEPSAPAGLIAASILAVEEPPTPAGAWVSTSTSETELQHLMHARYYNNAVGRFASVDPVGGNPSNPLSWNRYAYVQGNPLRFTDPTGKFQKDEHNEIIKKALPGLTEAERKTLEQASKTVDKDQSKEGSFKHAMRAEGQSASEATAKAEEFIGDKLSAASSVQAGHAEAGGKGLSPTALEHFGAAIHTVTDSASPTHQGFQEWRGLSLGAPSTFVDAAAHFLVERNASDSSKDTAVFAVRMLFESTFGADLAKSAFQTP